MKPEREPVGLATAYEKERSERKIYGQTPVPLSFEHINPFHEGQVRQIHEYDGIAELADSIEENDLIHPLTVVELPTLEAIEYINGVNQLWGTEYSINDLTPNNNDEYLILIAGHRRLKAVEQLIERNDRDSSDTVIQCNVRQGIGLTEALKLQFTENASQQDIEPSRDALAIQMYFNRRTREHEEAEMGRFSYAQCARELGVSAKQVKSAEDYFTLPVKVRESVDAGLYTYHWALRLVEFHETLKEAHPDWEEDEMGAELIAELQHSRNENFTASKFEKYLTARIDALDYEQQRLILSDEYDTPQNRADRAAESLIIRSEEDILLALGHLSLEHVNDFRENPVIQRLARRIGEVIAPLVVDEP